MTEPQIWTLIAVFASIMLGVQQWSFSSLRREMAAGFARQDLRSDALDAKIDDRFATLDAKIDDRFATLDAKIDHTRASLEVKIDLNLELVDARFSDVGHRLAALESDLTLIKGHLIRQHSA
ncbi:hypothetical protein [Nocardioides nitrophenolicus]|uniref:hypothetical protein n=1 Tax=Nocardioides nitrophenolicus TaxID=60489 RepID=UPI00195D04CB|nr:hypothetical protein [Nocardioides nitrophenolicus]MBM7516521.1 hypothetical protein [Nocardioides nitrophenolicus]